MKRAECHTEMLVLDDGRVLVHNLTPELASALSTLNPEDRVMKTRESAKRRVLASCSLGGKSVHSRLSASHPGNTGNSTSTR